LTINRMKNAGGFTLLELLVVAAIIAIIAAIAIPQLLNARRAAWQSRAKGTLRSIGSSQLAYQGTNNQKHYGTFKALQDTLYVAKGYNLSNMVENYSLSWTVTNLSDINGPGKYGIGNNRFTVIAFPRDTRPGFLNTFAVSDDQVVRVYNREKPSNIWASVTSWDPIL
jgi:prepilin-type N-terminal cleavage/methylation domain-containing protein